MLFQLGKFKLHSGAVSPFKIECDALDYDDMEAVAFIGNMSLNCTPFGNVTGIPRGGKRLACAMEKYRTPGSDTMLIVDDVLTTGASMDASKERFNRNGVSVVGLVIFSRALVIPPWIRAIFRMDVYMPS